jgi:general secretion pathway protein D
MLNLKDVDIRVFLEQISSITGENYVVDPDVQGKVTVISTTGMNPKIASELLLTVLRVNGLTAIPSGSVVRIASLGNSKAMGGMMRGDINNGRQMVTRVVKLKNANAEEAVKLLKPLASQSGYVDGSGYSGVLIISDYADNVAQIMKALDKFDKQTESEVEIINLKEAWVGNIVPLIEELAPSQLAEAGKANNRLRIVADERSNSIIVRGDADERRQVRKLVETFDQKSTNASNTQLIQLHYANAKEVAALLRGIVLSPSRSGQGGNETFVAPALPAEPQVPQAGQGQSANPATKANTSPASAPEPQVQSFIQADVALNALVVRAEPAIMSEIRSIVRELDITRPQVLIEAAIVEVSSDRTSQFGTQLAAGKNTVDYNAGATQFSTSGISISDVLDQLGNKTASSLSSNGITLFLGKNLNFNALINALTTTTGANLLSTPSITTLDNEEAKIVVGQNVPFRTGSFSTQNAGVTNPFTTIERQDIGVTLKVVPQILQDNLVRLKISQEVSSIAPANAQTSAAADLITNKRTIDTNVMSQNGETIVLGGLIQDDITESESSVPLLGDIPLLGNLFRSKSHEGKKSNLYVFLRPTILFNSDDATKATSERYGRVYDLMLGNKDIEDREPAALTAATPSANTIFNPSSKTLPWLVGEGHGTAIISEPATLAAPLKAIPSGQPIAAPALPVETSEIPPQEQLAPLIQGGSPAPFPWQPQLP